MLPHRIWAPDCSELYAVINEKRVQLRPLCSGWFEFPPLTAGDRYALLGPSDTCIPDPRSRSQPEGVDRPSEWLPACQAPVSEFIPAPLAQAVFYELHVGTFTQEGTFDAAITKLGYLVELGITHVEVMPVAAFMGEFGWGYDGAALYAVHAPYGGASGFRRFVEACHAVGVAVILDVVYNHLGPRGNYLGHFGPYFTERYHTSWGDALNFDGPQSDEVRRFFLDNARYWLEQFQLDGLRLDAVQAVFDGSALHFLEELSACVRGWEAEWGRRLLLIAESHLNDPRLVRSTELGGRGMDSMWSDDLHHALHALLTGERAGYYQDFGSLTQLGYVLQHGFYFDRRYSAYYQRHHGAPAHDMRGEQFVVYLQNHDQVGNRARGDRIQHGLSPARLKVGAATVLLGPYLPMIFQGEEWAASSPFPFFADPPDQALADAIRHGRLGEYRHFDWNEQDVLDPVARSTFESARLNWSEQEDEQHRDVLDWYKQLIALRRRLGGCAGRDEVRVHVDETHSVLTLERGPMRVVLCFGDEPVVLELRQNSNLVLGAGCVHDGDRLVTRGPAVAVLESESD